jgi:hypothetical protein
MWECEIRAVPFTDYTIRLVRESDTGRAVGS